MNVASLTAEDTALLCADAARSQLQIGALCFFEAEPLRDRSGRLRVADLRAHVGIRLAELPRFRQRIVPALAGLAAPVWVDDADFDLERHTKHARLDPPGDAAALRAFVSRLLSEPMDPDHPLWDIHTIEGLHPSVGPGGAQEAIAVLVRAHHVMADGIALHAAATLLLDAAPRRYRRQRAEWTAEPAPNAFELGLRALAERRRRQADIAGAVARTLLDPRRLGSNVRTSVRLLASVRRAPSAIAPPARFTGPVGRRRAFAWTSIPMADVVAIKRACDVTVNDVVLAIATGAVRRMADAGDLLDPGGRQPRALVPIGGAASGTGSLGNRFSFTSVTLPVGVDDPRERLRLLHAGMHPETPAPSIVPGLYSVTDVVPPGLLRIVAPPLLARQPFVNLAVSNIPGSRDPLYLWESRMLALHPFINVVGNLALIVGVLSYDEDLGVGVTVDPDVVGDPETVVQLLQAATDELVTSVRRASAGPRS